PRQRAAVVTVGTGATFDLAAAETVGSIAGAGNVTLFHLVDAPVGGNDVVEERAVAGAEAFQRPADLRFDQAAHLEYAGTDRLQLGVELLGKMLVHGRLHYDKGYVPCMTVL